MRISDWSSDVCSSDLNALDPQTGTSRARAVLPNPDGHFTPGLFARVQLLGSGRYAATLLDERAIGTDQSKKFVSVVDAKGTVQYRAVTLGGEHAGQLGRAACRGRVC